MLNISPLMLNLLISSITLKYLTWTYIFCQKYLWFYIMHLLQLCSLKETAKTPSNILPTANYL